MNGRVGPEPDATSVCVVIPTFNRQNLLLETLSGVANQTRMPDRVMVLDNASTDGTAEAVRSSHPLVDIVTLPVNLGSAGGFGHGVQWAVTRGYDWVWLLDNDSIPAPAALAELLQAHDRFPPGARPLLLATKVEWIDGSILPLNVPIFKRKELESFYKAAALATLSLRAAPYAGLLVNRTLIERYGLPVEEYFLWNDDIEWTGRLLRHEFGVLVPSAVICHKTPGRPTTTAELGPRFFYEVRNKLWLVRFSNGFTPMEKLRFVLTLVVDSARHVARTTPHRRGLVTVVRGLVVGLFSRAAKPAAR